MHDCTCHVCQAMCQQRPCWPTPDEAIAIIDAGFGPRLMLDYWAGDENTHRDILCPAIVGYERRGAPYWPRGRCTFLTSDNLCELHDLGLKPHEGRLASCDSTLTPPDLHADTALLWPVGSHPVIDRWRNL